MITHSVKETMQRTEQEEGEEGGEGGWTNFGQGRDR